MSRKPTHTRISPLEKIGYGLGDFGSNIVFAAVMMILPIFYTDTFGLGAKAMGTMFLAVRILDAITDPIMGSMCDRTRTRWGQFRPYLLWLAIPYGLLCVVLFTTPAFSDTGKLIYAYITYSLMMLAYTAINIPYCALGGVITPDSHERVSLNSYRFVLVGCAGILAGSTKWLANVLGQGNDQKGFQLAMGLLAILAVLAFWGCFFMTKERVKAASNEKTDLIGDLKSLFRNDQWRVVAALFFFLLLPLVLRGGGAAYYIKWFAGREDLLFWFLTTGTVCMMAGASLAGWVTKRLSVVKAYIMMQVLIIAGSVSMYFLKSDQLVLMFVLFGFVNFFVQMGAPLLFTMTADTVEYGEWKTGRRVTGLAFSGTLFTLKMGVALGGAMLAWILAFYGYESGDEVVTQTPRAIHGVVMITTLVPAIGHMILIPLISFYKLTTQRCADIRKELDQRAGNGE